MSWTADDTNRAELGAAESARDEARAWVVRLASGRVTAKDAAAFRHWHADDPCHGAAFAEAKLHWDLVGAATRDLALQPNFHSERRDASGTRRWFLAAGFATAAAGVAVVRPPFGLWSPVVDFAADYRTGIGERRRIELAHEITVELTTRSRMAIRSDLPETTVVDLLAGEAAISAGSRPVAVIAGPGEARTVGGRFNLRNVDGTVLVTCLAGRVEVACGGHTAALAAAQQVQYGERGLSAAHTVNADMVTAWQRGILVFHDQPLSRVIEEINRYRPGRIILLDKALAERPVATASVHIDRIDQIVPQIQALFGTQVRYLPGGIVLLS